MIRIVTIAVAENHSKEFWKLGRTLRTLLILEFRSRQILELLGTQESYKDFRIIYASKDSLHLSFIHKQYGQEHRISDYLVPLDVQISDRDFHHM